MPDEQFPQAHVDTSVSVSTLTATHPRYDACLPDWLRAIDLYEGENLERYLHKHERESTRSFNARKKRISYRNFCQPVVDLYLHYLFSKAITRSPSRAAYEQQKNDLERQRATRQEQRQRSLKEPHAPGSEEKTNAPDEGAKVVPIRPSVTTPMTNRGREWEEWQKNVDRRRTPLTRFMVDAGRWALVFGHAFVLIDLPSAKLSPRNEDERKRMQLQPYTSLYFPTEGINWDHDEDLRLKWIRFREPIFGGGEPFTKPETKQYGTPRVSTYADQDPARASSTIYQGKMVSNYRYRTFTREKWCLHEIRGNEVWILDEGVYPGQFDMVPVVPIYNRRSSRYPFLGVSLLSDIARLNTGILNLDSLIDEGVYQQTLNILVTSRQQGNQKEIKLSEDNVFEYTGNPPFFMSPSTAPLAFMEDRIQRFREEISRIAKLGGGLGLEPRSVMSGVALAYEFNETNAVLAERADEFESSEIQMHEMWFKWMGSLWDGVVDYPNEFSVQSFQEEIDLVVKAVTAVRSPTAHKEMEKRALKKILHNVPEEIRDQIEFETDFIPESVSTFSGPIFFDPIKQQWNVPGQQNPPVGVLGDLLGTQLPQPEESSPHPKQDAEKEEQKEVQAQQSDQNAAVTAQKLKIDAQKAKGAGKPPPKKAA